MNPIYNPTVPTNTPVSLHPGSMVYVTGVPLGHRFSVNFKCAPGEQADYALFFNPRFDTHEVVRNSMRNNKWDSNNETSCSSFPFQVGQAFEIIFLVQRNQFKIAVNGQHFVEYKHRIPFQNIRVVQVHGNAKIHMIKFDEEKAAAPAPAPMMVYNPHIPYKMTVPFGNIRGRSVTIKGIPENRDPFRMCVNFETDSNPPDIWFHLNPRFSERTIVRNTRMGMAWGREERALTVPFPFQFGVPFQVVIKVDQQCFRVELNGMVVCTYNHRQRPLNRIRYVNVTGSVRVNEIAFN